MECSPDVTFAAEGAPIPAGTGGVGLIATLDHSKSQGHSGYLVLMVGDAFYTGACRVEIDQR